MKKKENIVSYTFEELQAMPAPVIDWERINALTDGDIERAIADDPDEQAFMDPRYVKGPYKGIPFQGKLADRDQRPNVKGPYKGIPFQAAKADPKKSIQLKLDSDILAALKKTGRGYKQTLNQILRNYLNTHPEMLPSEFSQDHPKAA